MSRRDRFLSRRKRMMEDLDQDIRDYIERETQDNIACGMSPEEARYAALRKFGNVTQVKEETWEVWSFVWLEQLWQDVRFGLRILRKSPGFTAIAILTLALGIGANAAIFSVVNAVLLRPRPYHDPARLVWVTESAPLLHANLVASPDYLDWQESAKSFASLAAYGGGGSYNLTGKGGAERVYGPAVTASFLPQLGVQPEVGRLFTAEDDSANAPRVVLLSHGLWEGGFGSDRDIVGQTILLSGQAYTIIGVLPASFEFPGNPHFDVIVPLRLDPIAERTSGRMLIVRVIGRLKPRVVAAQARAE